MTKEELELKEINREIMKPKKVRYNFDLKRCSCGILTRYLKEGRCLNCLIDTRELKPVVEKYNEFNYPYRHDPVVRIDSHYQILDNIKKHETFHLSRLRSPASNLYKKKVKKIPILSF